jgi:protein-S-isoprenylcysteine O-methyltransferase Ste14
VTALWLAEPTWASLLRSLPFVAGGEALRIWAAGHLEKSREVTRSGPYAWMRHPLYFGSAMIAIGLVMASASRPVSLLIAFYLGTAIPAAVLAEEKHLREKFGGDYDAYKAHQAPPMTRRFSLGRAIVNREHHTIAGIAIGFALLALKVQLSIP